MNKRRITRGFILTLLLSMIMAFSSVSVFAEECSHEGGVLVSTGSCYEISDTQHATDYYYSDCSICHSNYIKTIIEDHNWRLEDEYYSEYSDTQHKITRIYICNNCGSYKTEDAYGNHQWVPDSEKWGQNAVSDTLHSYKQGFKCSVCDQWKDVEGTEAHNFDQYNECRDCNRIVANNRTLAPKKTIYVNEKSWTKINIKQTGYMKVTTGSKNCYWSLYNKSKSVYLDARYKENGDSVPVKKGTYYIKTDYNGALKYTISKNPSKKNYTKNKAINLKKNKKAVTVIYPTDKKNTWSRYYKVKLTKKQYLRISTGDNSTLWSDMVTDSKGKIVPCEWERDKEGNYKGFISSKKLKKGTYYIHVQERYTSASKKRSIGTVYIVSWK